MKFSAFPRLILGALMLGNLSLHAQLTWDPDTVTDGVQNGTGAWNLTNTNWYNGTTNITWDNSGSTIAAFGSSASKTGGTITVTGTMNVGGLRFNPFSTATIADVPVTSAYTITGGTLQFTDNAIIEAANNTTSGSSGLLFINLNSVVVGNGLTIQRPVETGINSFQYVRFGTANPNLTGVLNINARSASNGIFMLLTSSSTVSSMERIIVQNGSVLAAGGTGSTYNLPITIAGNGQASGAIRVDNSNIIFNGQITLTADAAIQTNRNVVNTVINSAITEGATSSGFQRFASSYNSVLTLNGTSTYKGATTIGRAAAGTPGITILNFAAANAPVADRLYNGLETAGGLNMIGGTIGTATFILQGKDSTHNSQRFGDLNISGNRSNLVLTSGNGGSMSVSLGAITRTTPGSITFTTDAPGAITTTTADGFLGPWSALVNRAGHGSWGNVSGGKLTAFMGSTEYATGGSLSSLGAAADVAINANSTGNVLGGTGTYQVNTLSMTDATSARVVDIGTGNVLQLGSTGGIQLTENAQSLDIGIAGSAGSLRAGTTTGQMWLTNLSKSGILTIHSVIENNGSNVLALYFNGTSKTVLAGANTYTGVTQIGSGEVEAAHSTALGSGSAATTVLANGSLRLSNNISLSKLITLSGLGFNGIGALVNTSGINELTQVVTISQPARVNSESGTLVFKGATGTTAVINASGTGATTFFGGAGDFLIQGQLNAAANVVTKDGAGTLTFAGTQVFTAALVHTAGTVHLDFSPATSPATNILYNGIATPVAMTLNGTSLRLTGKPDTVNSQTFGALTVTNLANINLNTNGATSLTLNYGTLTRSFGGILGMEIPTGSSIRVNSGTDNALITSNGRAYAYIRDSVNGDEWAGTGAASGGTRPIVKLSTLSGSAGYTSSTETSLSGNANIALNVTTTTLAASTTVNTLRFAQPQATLITDSPAGTTLTTSGILVSSTVGANTSTISTGILRASPSTVASTNPDLQIIQNNVEAPLVITSNISNSLLNTGAAGIVSVIKAGPGVLELSGANTYTGYLRVHEGTVHFTGGSINSLSDFIIGSGATSGKVILGQGSTPFSPSMDYIQSVGIGTENRIVGGATVMSQLLITGSAIANTTSDFRTGILGGPGLYENNLEFRLASLDSLVRLGPANTYAGATIIGRGIVEVETLANLGEASSFGTGNSSSTITMANATTGAVGSYATAVIRYTGSTDSVTNRPLRLANDDLIRDIAVVTAVLENIGTGTMKFTTAFTSGGSNLADRILHLTGTNIRLNEIVSINNASATILTSLKKDGVGTWALTGDSTYSGGTTVTEGTLLANNAPFKQGTTTPGGSATGLGKVTVGTLGILGGTGRIAPSADNSVFISGGVLNPGLPGINTSAGRLTIDTLGSGMLMVDTGSTFLMDLVLGAGLGDNTLDATSADLLVVSGQITIGSGTTLRVANPNGMTTWAVNDQWQLFDWSGLTGSVTGSFDNYELPALPEGLAWNVDSLYTSGVLSVALVPEPGRLALLGLAFFGLIMRRRR